jgi:hypothetical protein
MSAVVVKKEKNVDVKAARNAGYVMMRRNVGMESRKSLEGRVSALEKQRNLIIKAHNLLVENLCIETGHPFNRKGLRVVLPKEENQK